VVAFKEPLRSGGSGRSPTTRAEILRGASHHTQEDAPDEIVAAISAWWPGG
jgi:pimeloyl-ACP methyl ester carboxylesterase